MFTGIIQALGTVKPLGGDFWQITCVQSAQTIMTDLAYGDSIAVDGVCLTVETILNNGFTATASPETLRRTTLGEQLDLHYVNLEASMRVGGKVGGHFVMGHVDGVGELIASTQTATSWEMTFSAPPTVSQYIVPKGSIAVNGISLTVAQCDAAQFQVAVIPTSYTDTNLNYLIPGSKVNLEADILGKYVEKFLLGKSNSMQNSPKSDITATFLTENGYL